MKKLSPNLVFGKVFANYTVFPTEDREVGFFLR